MHFPAGGNEHLTPPQGRQDRPQRASLLNVGKIALNGPASALTLSRQQIRGKHPAMLLDYPLEIFIKTLNLGAPSKIKMSSSREIHLRRKEAKWQFRRGLVLEAARLLEVQPESTWPKISQILGKLSSSPSPTIRRNTKRWLRFAGKTPIKTIHVIQTYFGTDTPDGPRRQKLQDLSDGHPFSGIVSESTLKNLRESVACGKFPQVEGAKEQ